MDSARKQDRPAVRKARKKSQNWREVSIKKILWLSVMVSLVTTVGIVAMLVIESIGFFSHVSPGEFFTGTKWTPLFEPQHFGILPLVVGTLQATLAAIIVAVPLGLGSAIYLSEYAPERVRRVLKPVLEILAGIPTVVYGFFALTFVTPVLRMLIPATNVFNVASAGIVMGIMLLPMVSSLSEDAMIAVPRSLREAGYALGATKLEVATRVVLPAATSGLTAAFILAISRAIGETMIVAMAAGATPKLTFNPLDSIQTMTGYIAQVSQGETPHGSLEYQSIFAVGAALFAMTMFLNILGFWVVRRYREEY